MEPAPEGINMGFNNLTIQEKQLARLRVYKEMLNITYHELSEQSGLPESTVKKVMTGQTKSPRRKTVEQLEKVLGITERIKASDTYTKGSVAGLKAPWISGNAAEKLPDLGETEAFLNDGIENIPYSSDKRRYTIADYYALPDDIRVELMDGMFYYMEAPSTYHQAIIFQISMQIGNFISKNKGTCKAFFAPLDVQLDCDDYTMLQPDILIVCDKEKLKEKCVFGAPDFACEVVSPSNSANYIMRKSSKYLEAGVREYWEVNIKKKNITVYYFEKDEEPCTYTFTDKVPVRIYGGKLKIDFKVIEQQLDF